MEILRLPKINDPRGNLSFIEGGSQLPYEIQRCYWIYDVPGGKVRHGRALRTTTECVVALSGSFDVVIDDGHERRTVHMCRSYEGVLIPPMHWREIVNFSTNSVAMVLASAPYDEEDYIRDRSTFLNATGHGEQS